jgi:hypothetical protein
VRPSITWCSGCRRRAAVSASYLWLFRVCCLPVGLGCIAEEMSETERKVLDGGGELDMERCPDLHCVLRPPLAWLEVMPL